MANPTTNYGFVLPTSSDLVTDLPADFDVALQGVDTRLKALQPGTTLGDLAYSSATANTNTRLPIGTNGQVLAVVGGVPAWSSEAGDISSVTAGTGISGGGTSGDVTITNSMATAITTNGDLIYGTGAGTFTRRGIGSTGQVLRVASGVPTWETLPSSSPTSTWAEVVTNQGTTSTSFTNLSTTGPSVTITTGTKALVSIRANCQADGSARGAQASVEVSGATTLAAAEKYQVGNYHGGTSVEYVSAANTFLLTGLTAGSNTFTMKYRAENGGLCNFSNRQITVIDMGS